MRTFFIGLSLLCLFASVGCKKTKEATPQTSVKKKKQIKLEKIGAQKTDTNPEAIVNIKDVKLKAITSKPYDESMIKAEMVLLEALLDADDVSDAWVKQSFANFLDAITPACAHIVTPTLSKMINSLSSTVTSSEAVATPIVAVALALEIAGNNGNRNINNNEILKSRKAAFDKMAPRLQQEWYDTWNRCENELAIGNDSTIDEGAIALFAADMVITRLFENESHAKSFLRAYYTSLPADKQNCIRNNDLQCLVGDLY